MREKDHSDLTKTCEKLRDEKRILTALSSELLEAYASNPAVVCLSLGSLAFMINSEAHRNEPGMGNLLSNLNCAR